MQRTPLHDPGQANNCLPAAFRLPGAFSEGLSGAVKISDRQPGVTLSLTYVRSSLIGKRGLSSAEEVAHFIENALLVRRIFYGQRLSQLLKQFTLIAREFFRHLYVQVNVQIAARAAV